MGEVLEAEYPLRTIFETARIAGPAASIGKVRANDMQIRTPEIVSVGRERLGYEYMVGIG
jgi:citrate synthase